MPDLILRAVVANRYVMREIPHLLRHSDVKITRAIGDVLLEIGTGEFFPSLAKNIALLLSGPELPAKRNTIAGLRQSTGHYLKTRFFGSCSYLTYGMVKAS